MNLFNLKEIAGRARFTLDRIRYIRRRHINLTFFMLLLILVVVFTVIFTYQQAEIKKKENILKSYYFPDPLPGDADGNKETPITAGDKPGEGIEEKIYIHICGEVAEPGVYLMEPGSRVNDAIRMAGGATESAFLPALNLVQKLCDGQKIYIPSQNEVSSGGSWAVDYIDTGVPGNTGSTNLLVNINTAGIDILQSLPGIGPAIAANIVDYREKHGSFGTIEELERVDGIGPKKYEKIKDLVTV
ncbi:MAG: helix-hairpin-helix domain-containing protein [Actinobacteria bacterium]|nr:helix-hairpin-helix domain-containing protein [Actinomycetota bacterium]